jgi:YD repeat-containing protein
MLNRTIFASLLALGIGAGFTVPALAQQNSQFQSNATEMSQQNDTRRVISSRSPTIRGWNYDRVYQNGWSADRMIDDADVIGAGGEDLGEVTNIIIGEGGRIRGIIATVGGFWGIGDTRVFVPWNQFRYVPADNRVYIPLTEDNVDYYEAAAAELLMRGNNNQIQAVEDDYITGASLWKATDLIDDYVYFNNRNRYGYVTDLIFRSDGTLYAYVANPSAGYGYGRGPRAFPYYTGTDYSWNPGTAYFNAPFDETDAANLEPFEYNRLRTPMVVGGWNVNESVGSNRTTMGDPNQDTATGSTGPARTALQWTFRDLDQDRDLELTNREFATVSSEVFNRWDRNGDGRLTATELTSGIHTTMDRDRDGRISRREFNRGWNRWGFGSAGLDFNSLDRERDGYISEAELGDGLNTSGYFDNWNLGDTGMAENDFTNDLYSVWDRDESGVLDEAEYNGLASWNWF